jgi:hypothetical protein
LFAAGGVHLANGQVGRDGLQGARYDEATREAWDRFERG